MSDAPRNPKPENNRKDHAQDFTVEQRPAEAYRLQLKGYKIKEIAKRLVVSPSTVEKDLKQYRGGIVARRKMMEKSGVIVAFDETITQLDLAIHCLWQLADMEEDSQKRKKLVESVTKITIKKFELIKDGPRVPKTQDEQMQDMLDNIGYGHTLGERE